MDIKPIDTTESNIRPTDIASHKNLKSKHRIQSLCFPLNVSDECDKSIQLRIKH